MMFGNRRRYQVSDVATPEELAEKLTQHSWTLCTGFRLAGVLFLNDSSSEDGAGEWGIIRDGKQVESITFSWCTEEKALGYIRAMLAGAECEATPCTPNLEHGSGACHLCA
jgi:hypothetical protein